MENFKGIYFIINYQYIFQLFSLSLGKEGISFQFEIKCMKAYFNSF